MEESGLLETLSRHAEDMGPHGIPTVLRMVEKRLRAIERASGSSAGCDVASPVPGQPASPA